MEKTLRLLGLAAVIGSVAIVAAQQSAGRARTAPPASGAPLATASSGWISSNEVTELMLQYFCSKQNLEIELAQLAGRQDRVQPIILANCASMLTVMTPEQRAREIKVWELDKYAPGSPEWAGVCRAPSMADRLLKVDAAKRAVAAKATDEVWAPIRSYTDDLDKRLFQTPEWKAAKTKHEQNLAHYAFYQQYGTKTPLIDRKKASVARYEASISKVRASLSPGEREEFDRIVDRFEKAISAAAHGKKPIP